MNTTTAYATLLSGLLIASGGPGWSHNLLEQACRDQSDVNIQYDRDSGTRTIGGTLCFWSEAEQRCQCARLIEVTLPGFPDVGLYDDEGGPYDL